MTGIVSPGIQLTSLSGLTVMEGQEVTIQVLLSTMRMTNVTVSFTTAGDAIGID